MVCNGYPANVKRLSLLGTDLYRLAIAEKNQQNVRENKLGQFQEERLTHSYQLKSSSNHTTWFPDTVPSIRGIHQNDDAGFFGPMPLLAL